MTLFSVFPSVFSFSALLSHPKCLLSPFSRTECSTLTSSSRPTFSSDTSSLSFCSSFLQNLRTSGVTFSFPTSLKTFLLSITLQFFSFLCFPEGRTELSSKAVSSLVLLTWFSWIFFSGKFLASFSTFVAFSSHSEVFKSSTLSNLAFFVIFVSEFESEDRFGPPSFARWKTAANNSSTLTSLSAFLSFSFKPFSFSTVGTLGDFLGISFW